MGQKLYSGFSSGINGFLGGSFGNPAAANFVGPPAAGQAFGGAYGGYNSGFGQALGIGGSAYAGVSEYNRAGGGVAGVAGGLAYGAGTYVAGAALSGAAAGTGAIAGLGALGPIGWIALGAMVIDTLSGGKLFGTAGKMVEGSTALNVTSTGANETGSYTLKGQQPLFGGSSWTAHDFTPDKASQDAAAAFFKQLQDGTTAFAKQFGETIGTVVGGTFQSIFDKNGKPTGVTNSTVLGVTYKNETQTQFAERLQADSYLGVLDKMGLGASKFVASLQGNADKLFAGVMDFATTAQAVNVDLKSGLRFMAAQAGTTLVSVMAFVEGFRQGGETLVQAYTRLAQAQNAYDKFVSAFKPAATYVDDFEAKLAGINDGMKANIATANALAKAAGAEGASVSDLVNIHQAAANQFSALVANLQTSMQSLAFSLGITTKGSLSDVNAEIARLQGSANGASGAVRNFGGAIASTAASATAAIALLLGQLSPLSDAQKLQVALAGQRAGTVTPDQVLTIGRALYASSQAYVQLFAQVQSIGDHTGAGGASSGGGGGASSGSTQSLSATDQARLTALLKERDTLQASQTLGQYQTLAQQIAEFASAKGISYQQVMKDMGVSQKDLEKGLNIKSDADLNTYIKNIQKQTDSNKDNTTSIVNEIHLVLLAILNGNAMLTSRDGKLMSITDSLSTDRTTIAASLRNNSRFGQSTNIGTVDLSPSTINAIGDALSRRIGNSRSTRATIPA